MLRKEALNNQGIKQPETVTGFEGAGSPPRVPNANGTLDNEGGGEATDAELFWSLYRQPVEVFSGLDTTIEKYNLMNPSTIPVPDEKVGKFLEDAMERGLIKKLRPLSLRQYIGALLPWR